MYAYCSVRQPLRTLHCILCVNSAVHMKSAEIVYMHIKCVIPSQTQHDSGVTDTVSQEVAALP
jgi:hypothetical protein